MDDDMGNQTPLFSLRCHLPSSIVINRLPLFKVNFMASALPRFDALAPQVPKASLIRKIRKFHGNKVGLFRSDQASKQASPPSPPCSCCPQA